MNRLIPKTEGLVLLGCPRHHVGWRALVAQLFGHEIHVGCYVAEETSVIVAEIVETRCTIGRGAETILWATSVAGEEPLALTALLR